MAVLCTPACQLPVCCLFQGQLSVTECFQTHDPLLTCIQCLLSRAHSQRKLVIPSQFLNNPSISPRISRTKGREKSSLNHLPVSVPAVRHRLHLQVTQIIIMLLETQEVLRTQRGDFKKALHVTWCFHSVLYNLPYPRTINSKAKKKRKRAMKVSINTLKCMRCLSTNGRYKEGGDLIFLFHLAIFCVFLNRILINKLYIKGIYHQFLAFFITNFQ